MEFKTTQRGFTIANFEDRNGVSCSLQESSLATEEVIWLGTDNPDPRIMVSDASRMGILDAHLRNGEEANGWMSYPIPKEVIMNDRMHLTREMVGELLPYLRHFVHTGELTGDIIIPLEDQHTEDCILENLVYDMEWLDVNKMDESIAFLKSKYVITRR